MGDNLEEPFTTGPDGRLWAVSNPVSGSTAAEQVDAITTQGAFTQYPLAGADVTGTGTEPFAITTGSDGNIWAGGFTTTPQWGIYRVTPAGASTFYNLPGLPGFPAYIGGVTTGSDGNLWAVTQNGQIDVIATGAAGQ